jgi:multisubunit Na+/H+ antiporter MnhB subunit
MIKPCYGACIGLIGGLVVGWIVITFVLDPDYLAEFQDVSSISINLIAGLIGLFIGFAICYVVKQREEYR